MRKGWTAVLGLVLVAVAAGCGEKSDEAAREETLLDRPMAEWLTDLKEGEPKVRAHAAQVLRGAEPSPLVLRELIAALEDEDIGVRREVGRVLQRIGGDHDEAAVALARAIRDDPGGAGDIFWMRGADGEVRSPAAMAALVEILMDPNLSWDVLEQAAKMLHSAHRESALAAIPESLSPEQREALALLVRHGPAFRLVRAVETIIGDPVRSESEFTSRDSDGLLDAECTKAPFAREKITNGRPRPGSYPAEKGAVPRFTVVAIDAETGDSVPAVILVLRDGKTGDLRGRIAGSAFSSVEPPRDGDELVVYARGYELARVVLFGDEDMIDMALERAEGRFTVGPVEPAESVGEVRATAMVFLVHEVDGKKQALIRDSIAVEFGPEGTAGVPVPRGLEVHVRLDMTGDGLIWPNYVNAVSGGGLPIRVEPSARKRIRIPGPGYFGEPALSLDLTASPGWPRRKVDAFTLWRFHHDPMFVAKGEELYLDAPDVGWHLFARWEGRRFYLRVPAGVEEVPIPSELVKRVFGHPMVDGEPVPFLTILAPGALDLDTIRGIGVRGHRVEGYSHAVCPGARWADVTLPHSEWLTAWHPAKGTAWLEWKEGEAPTGRWLPGRIEIRGEPSERLTGTARINPAWPGAGSIRTSSSFEPLEQSIENAESIVFPGLANGTYRVHLNLEVKREGAEPEKTRKSITVAIDETEPVKVFTPDGQGR